jgi:MFS family permease
MKVRPRRRKHRKSLPHRALSWLIRFPFGGGTQRPHHLRMAIVAALVAGWSAFYLCREHLGLPLWASALLSFVALIGSWLQEAWASADRDEEEKRKPANLHWLAFGRSVKHRSWVSHAPVIGTAVRLFYGYLGAPFGMLWVGWHYPAFGLLLPIGVAWIYGALVNDLGHLILDI